jgi:hypothetical protein
MRRVNRLAIVLCAAVVLGGSASLRTSDPRSAATRSSPRGAIDPNGVIAHEWGTFTSVAGPEGSAVEWIPQQGPSDLPCFVNRARTEAKYWLRAMVRMETPVLYFYSPQDATLDVRVRFRRGVMTEWYPRAEVTPAEIRSEMLATPSFTGEISWKQVKVLPRAAEDFPDDSTRNHYYAARATDAAPVQVGTEREKFLFYRGVANFTPPLEATIVEGGRVSVRAPESLGDVVLFQNRGGLTAHHVLHSTASHAVMPVLTPGTRGSVATDLENLLVTHGLYRREAQAMIDTWRDSWFEEGSRLFYIVPRRVIDNVLPLDITPAAASVARVFVGRLELLTSETIDDVKASLAKRDRVGIQRHRRFLDPIMMRIHPTMKTDAARSDWMFVYQSVTPPLRACR